MDLVEKGKEKGRGREKMETKREREEAGKGGIKRKVVKRRKEIR